jgi:hypothetical protein
MKSRSMEHSSKGIALVVLIAAAFGSSVAKSTPPNEVSPQSIAGPAQILSYLPVLGDFDGDRRLDQAELHLAGSHHCIRVRFGNSRETHLDLGTRPHVGGMLLVLDVNRDDMPDLIWVDRSRLEPAVVWLNDGAGHFARSGDWGLEATVDSLFGDADYLVTGRLEDEQICLAPTQSASESQQATSLDRDSFTGVMIAGRDLRRDLGLYLSYLRERGPPQVA